MEGTHMKVIAILVVALMTGVPHVSAATGNGTNSDSMSIATYRGGTIDLRRGFGTAKACYVAQQGTSCFDSEAEMDAYIASTEAAPVAPATQRDSLVGPARAARRTSCGTTLRLYDGTNYTTPVVGIAIRFTVIDLATVGFDNATASFKVGACSASMWAGSGATGGAYPGSSGAGVQSPTMSSGWTNVVSSVYLS
jgi:hypothetical protein